MGGPSFPEKRRGAPDGIGWHFIKFTLRFNETLTMISLTGSVGTAIKTGVAFAITGVAVLQPYRPMIFMGSSMEPTYSNQAIVLTKPTEPGDLKHGEVVVIEMDSGPDC